MQPSCRLRIEQCDQQVKFYLLVVVQDSTIITIRRHEGTVNGLQTNRSWASELIATQSATRTLNTLQAFVWDVITEDTKNNHAGLHDIKHC
jgi:hypothetical protein